MLVFFFYIFAVVLKENSLNEIWHQLEIYVILACFTLRMTRNNHFCAKKKYFLAFYMKVFALRYHFVIMTFSFEVCFVILLWDLTSLPLPPKVGVWFVYTIFFRFHLWDRIEYMKSDLFLVLSRISWALEWI